MASAPAPLRPSASPALGTWLPSGLQPPLTPAASHYLAPPPKQRVSFFGGGASFSEAHPGPQQPPAVSLIVNSVYLRPIPSLTPRPQPLSQPWATPPCPTTKPSASAFLEVGQALAQPEAASNCRPPSPHSAKCVCLRLLPSPPGFGSRLCPTTPPTSPKDSASAFWRWGKL